MRAFEAPGALRSAHPSAPRGADGRRWTRPSSKQRAKFARAVVLRVVFCSLLAAAASFVSLCLMTPAPPPEEETATASATYRMGRAVYPLGNGTTCRQVLFDNETGAMSARRFVPCERVRGKPEPAAAEAPALAKKEFTWGR
jgi:hypothetical protein